MEKQKKVRFELKITEDEKVFLKMAAAEKGKPVNKYVMDLVKDDKAVERNDKQKNK